MRNSHWSSVYDPDEDFCVAVIDDSVCDEMSRSEALLHDAFIKIPGDSWQAKLDHCASCKCCPRHQTFRPDRLVYWTDQMAERDVKIHYLKPAKCRCNCRNMARFICRNIDSKCPLAGPVGEDAM
jgi:hypothetical protein